MARPTSPKSGKKRRGSPLEASSINGSIGCNAPRQETRQSKIPKLSIDTSVSSEAPESSNYSGNTSSTSQPDSLFDGDAGSLPKSNPSDLPLPEPSPALIDAPPIPGFFYTPSLRLPTELADTIVAHCLRTYFTAPHIDQVMLFCRGGTPENPPTGLPPIFLSLLDKLSGLLKPSLPPEVHELLFPASTTLARQAIVNRYEPGQGITAHVDLLKRFGDGIIGVSFASGCVMQFASVPDEDGGEEKRTYDFYLPEGSVIVMTGDARYKWTHGIDKRTADFVDGEDGGRWLERSMRMSITFRWLLPGADILT
ncbi:hypothetical protein CPB85DRAFT_135103 [Mucidula mucida]|nr:hypothetical protein CPB85DRAFT_135103 [Mucidula mucida]